MKIIGFLFAALMLLAPAMPAAANAFVKTEAICAQNKRLICPRIRTLDGKTITVGDLVGLSGPLDPRTLQKIRVYNQNPNINWNTPIPNGTRIAYLSQ